MITSFIAVNIYFWIGIFPAMAAFGALALFTL